MRDLEFQIQLQILTAFKTAAELNDVNFFKSRGISETTVKNLRDLPVTEITNLAKLTPFQLTCPEALLNTRILAGINKDKEKKLIEKAIKFGASRKCLQAFTTINSKQYQKLTNEIRGFKLRDKPPRIDAVTLQQISLTHNNIKKREIKLGRIFNALEILIKLSETHNLEINQLYSYYYCDNVDLFNSNRKTKNK